MDKYDRVNRRGNWHKDKGKFGAYFSVTGESLKLLLLLSCDLKVFLIDNPFWAVRDMYEICRKNGGMR